MAVPTLSAVSTVSIFAVALGGAAGAMLRYLLTAGLANWLSKPWLPYGTLLVNVLGSFALGWCLAWLQVRASNVPAAAQLGLTVGLFGGLTTFSTFAAETLNLLMRGDTAAAFANILLNSLLCIVAVFAAMQLYKIA